MVVMAALEVEVADDGAELTILTELMVPINQMVTFTLAVKRLMQILP